MITLPSSPDETFGNDYTLRFALGEGAAAASLQSVRSGEPALDLNPFFTIERQECAH
jgi:hypothetical protein